MSSPGATAQMRAAKFTTVPMAVYSVRPAKPISPHVANPDGDADAKRCLASARRGELWLLSYEAIRAADRARGLLDEPWLIARSANTYVLLMEAFERSRGIIDSTPQTRFAELTRRQSMPDPAATEGRVRLALDSELDRLGLTKS